GSGSGGMRLQSETSVMRLQSETSV
nr:Chain B, Vangl2 peptide [Homo sapiens]7R2M_E Chain E, Vangl2 peptide [Homo sapiens]